MTKRQRLFVYFNQKANKHILEENLNFASWLHIDELTPYNETVFPRADMA